MIIGENNMLEGFLWRRTDILISQVWMKAVQNPDEGGKIFRNVDYKIILKGENI